MMSLKFEMSASAHVYLAPTGWCAPDYRNSDHWQQIAGLPVWASAVRVIVRTYEGRSDDRVFPVSDMPDVLDALGREDAKLQWARICSARAQWNFGNKYLSFSQPKLMGILNATPDSFSDGGDTYDPTIALSAAQEMALQGADIIDIGGESTRPGAKVVWEGDELERVIPVLQGCQNLGAVLSLDTRKAAVMDAGLKHGANIINDVSALTFDPESLALISNSTCPVILMHAQGDPQSMQISPTYQDVVLDVYDALAGRLEDCVSAGIARDRIAIDPGIGFGKTLQHNLALINNLSIFHGLGCPVMLGVSRKRFIGALAKVDEPKARQAGSLTAALEGLNQGAHILRVHDVAATRQMLDVWGGLRDQQQMPTASL